MKSTFGINPPPAEELCRKNGETTPEMIVRLRRLGVHTPTKGMIKTPEQIEGCREAGRVNSLVLDAVEREICIGMTTQEIDDIVMRETKALGGLPACLGYEGFPRAVCTSVNDVVCHGIPSDKVVLRDGDIVNVDCTTTYGGYFGDASRMFMIGTPSREAKRLVETVRYAVEETASHVRPYTYTLGDIGYDVNSICSSRGYSVVRDIGGHGVGLRMHEDPYVCHVGTPRTGLLFLPGMIFTIEPMVNAGREEFTVDRHDGWTVRTADGSLSAQVEYEILVTEDSYEILSK